MYIYSGKYLCKGGKTFPLPTGFSNSVLNKLSGEKVYKFIMRMGVSQEKKCTKKSDILKKCIPKKKKKSQ